jgi:hypothetical protein
VNTPASRFVDERRRMLGRLSESLPSIEAVLSYCDSPFDLEAVDENIVFPMAEEGHLEDWRQFEREQGGQPFEYLRERLVQLRIPITKGISSTEAYAGVARRGQPFDAQVFGGELQLIEPEKLRFVVHEHPAGALPVFVTPVRKDFETLDRALVERHEPVDLNPSVNAHLVSGSINWYRVQKYRAGWQAAGGHLGGTSWTAEMGRVVKTEPWRFFDRFLLMGEDDYSSVKATTLGLGMDRERWRSLSTTFRMEHEFMHYTTKRLFNSMNLNLFDETVCDWIGMVRAMEKFKSRWFLQFLGMNDAGEIRPSGRFHAYAKPLEGASRDVLAQLMVAVAERLEGLSARHYQVGHELQFALALTQMSLELIACDGNDEFFERGYEAIGDRMAS